MTELEPCIFLCHAKEDKPRVRELYHRLKAAGYHPWLDEEDLLPGVDWEREIRRAIRGSAIFLACLSQKSLTRKGYVHKEITLGLDELDQMPEDKIYLIPVRLEPCQMPDRLGSRHWVNLFDAGGFERLKRALDFELGPHPAPPEPELIHIPAGEFLMGSDPDKDREAYGDEQPQHSLHLPEYYMARTPVTNAQYLTFLEATGHPAPERWREGKPPSGKDDHPVVQVTWYDAVAYCQWLAKATGKAYRLPSEAEWEKAARGADGRIYPWGDEPPDEGRCNFAPNEGGTTPVGQYSPGGDSPYGCVDMAGNVWERTSSLWGKKWDKPDFKYPYDPKDGREDLHAAKEMLRVVRGGSWLDNRDNARCVFRGWDDPCAALDHYGFRMCVTAQQT